MSGTSLSGRTEAAPAAGSKALRQWLALLSVAAIAVACGAVIMGLLVMMDTQIETNPHGDPLVRQDALGFRIFAWAGISVLILLLAGGTVGAWAAYRKGRPGRSFGLSLLAAAPMLLLIAGIAFIYLGKSP